MDTDEEDLKQAISSLRAELEQSISEFQQNPHYPVEEILNIVDSRYRSHDIEEDIPQLQEEAASQHIPSEEQPPASIIVEESVNIPESSFSGDYAPISQCSIF